ncbi:MAG: flagellin FliC, partial [Pseudomonadota bacterium]|nr:flagellin FliC [Pseudomonadota bacterium]
MSLFVNTNVSSLNAQRQLFTTGNNLSTAFERLSSGFRINSAADDAAGLQITDRMTSQVQGLNQAVRNANDGISLAQTAEGAMQETTTALQRIRTLAIQSQNGINSSADRVALQKEVSALRTEISRISTTTQFAGVDVLTGDFSAKFLVGANA